MTSNPKSSCGYCGKPYFSKENLDGHIEEKHGEVAKVDRMSEDELLSALRKVFTESKISSIRKRAFQIENTLISYEKHQTFGFDEMLYEVNQAWRAPMKVLVAS